MEYLSQKKFFKITNERENHHGFQYVDGLNILKEPFAETGSCVPGGLYFTDANNILEFLTFGVHLREITLPLDDPDFKIVKDSNNKWRANKIIFEKRYNLWKKEAFEYLVSVGVDIHFADDYMLLWASKNGYLEVVKYLVSIGANIHANKDQAVRMASKKGKLQVVKYLVSVAANIHADNDGALRWASKKGCLEVVKYLVSVDADIHALDNGAIKGALRNGNSDVVKYLVSVGAKLE